MPRGSSRLILACPKGCSMARAFVWNSRRIIDSISTASGFEPLLTAPLPHPFTLERVVCSLRATLPNVTGSQDLTDVWGLQFAQAIEVTTGTDPTPPPFPERIDMTGENNLRDFLWTGSYTSGVWYDTHFLGAIPGEETILIDTGTRRSPAEGETLAAWFVWDCRILDAIADQHWIGWVNSLVSVEEQPI